VAPLQGAAPLGVLSGGLRYALTTGYYLTALQAEIRSLRFAHPGYRPRPLWLDPTPCKADGESRVARAL
jgi:hypothetical protein